jgi:hypothetical protein
MLFAVVQCLKATYRVMRMHRSGLYHNYYYIIIIAITIIIILYILDKLYLRCANGIV